MAKIDTLLEMLVQRHATHAVLVGNKSFHLFAGAQKTEGSVIPTEQLREIVAEITPPHLRAQIAQDGSFYFQYHSPYGTFDFGVDNNIGVLQVNIKPTPPTAAHPGVAHSGMAHPGAGPLRAAHPATETIPPGVAPPAAMAGAPPVPPHSGVMPPTGMPQTAPPSGPLVSQPVGAQGTIVCPKCGTPNQPGTPICPACGNALQNQTNHKTTVVDQVMGNGSMAEIIQYESLSGSEDISIAHTLFYAQQSGVRLKQVRITLNGGAIITEAGTLHFMKGHLTMDAPVGGLEGFAKKLASNVLTKETFFKPRYTGVGVLHLEPTFGHFIITHLNNEEMIVDKGMFYAAEASIDVSVAVQKHLSSAFLGGEGFFQTRLAGRGWCVLCSPVPADEIVRYQLNNERLSVDGNFALLRKGRIDFTVERSVKSFLGSVASGEGGLQTFTGTGEVWIAPTQSVYQRIKQNGIETLAQVKGSYGQNVKT